jgi:hypothetical protein
MPNATETRPAHLASDWMLIVRSHRGVESTTTWRTRKQAQEHADGAAEDALFPITTEIKFVG